MRSQATPIIVHAALTALLLTGCDEESAGLEDSEACSDTEPSDEVDPVPEAAQGVAIDPATGFALEELGSDLYWVTNGIEQVVFAVTEDGVVLVDAPESMAQVIPAAIATVTDRPISHVIYSHAHRDHIGAAGTIAPSATFVGQEETRRELERAADPNRPVPSETFDAERTLVVGSTTIELTYPGPNHVPGNIFVRFPEQRLLMVVDVVWPGWIPFRGLGEVENVPGYLQTLDEITSIEFDVFVGGHVGRWGTRADVEDTREYVQDLVANAGQALATVDFQALAQQYGYDNPYLVVDRYFRALAETCAEPVVERWRGKLGGADIWTDENCSAIVQYLRVD